MPHVWIGAGTEKVSTLDLVGKGRFALLTGIGGEPWVEAARAAAEALGIELATYVIGPGREHTDLYDDWARAREVAEDGCVLVRPDAHVAWRSHALVDDPDAALLDALRLVLDRAPDPATAGSGLVAAGEA